MHVYKTLVPSPGPWLHRPVTSRQLAWIPDLLLCSWGANLLPTLEQMTSVLHKSIKPLLA